MSEYLYTFALQVYALLIRQVSLWNPKAKQWVSGRKALFAHIAKAMQDNTAMIAWFHCASLGEFEQARPVIEEFRKRYPDYKIFLTFFSPSGFEVQKNYPGADFIFYLPLDTSANALQFIKLVKPSVAFFAKYEFWYHYLTQLKREDIPAISFSAIFRQEQVFFKLYGRFFRKTLQEFEHIFVQNQQSADLLKTIGIRQVTVAGDTRFDRVKAICEQKKDLPLVQKFKNGQKVLVIGSCWPQDMAVLIPFLNSFTAELKVIIAPHEIHEEEIKDLQKQLQKKSVRFSKAQENSIEDEEVLIIDNIGMLSSLYQYGEFAYIGGAFGKGLHNILEAATFGMPIFFGPSYHKFQEAKDLIELKAAISITSTEEFSQQFSQVYAQEAVRKEKAQMAQQYVAQHTGATEKILNYCRKLLPVNKSNFTSSKNM
jgi:3-deoxy-D-manno-octulosonic-acid transferase